MSNYLDTKVFTLESFCEINNYFVQAIDSVPDFPSCCKQIENQTEYVMQMFTDVKQQAVPAYDPQEQQDK